jgi:exoribonuclease-2
MGAQGLPRGARVLVKLGDIDLVSLDIHGTVIDHLDAQAMAMAVDDDQDDEDAVSGPIAIAMDVSETDAGDAPASPEVAATP